MKKKAYIMTFHWATNYGAVLQCYALQQYMRELGFTIEIINYVPDGYEKSIKNCINSKNINNIIENFMDLYKERKIEKFRQTYLFRTKKFVSFSELTKHDWENCYYIVGSDQIWNPFFTMNGECNPVSSYYLGFINNGKKIAYAASFGTETISEPMSCYIKPFLEKFNFISVRENTGKQIIDSMGLKCEEVCDPVFLHDKVFYSCLFDKTKNKFKKKYILKYCLHGDEDLSNNASRYLSNSFQIPIKSVNKSMGIEQWLKVLSCADYVVSNSFHAIAFSIIFNVPFVAVLIQGSGMNDRILTLLNLLGLENRILSTFSPKKIQEISKDKIDWERINKKVDLIRIHSQKMLNNHLNKGSE